MFLLKARNTNEMMNPAYSCLHEFGEHRSSRNGETLTLPGALGMVYSHPWERVNACPVRDANPFFHLFEAMAMLANHNDVEWLAWFVPRMREFSDDGHTFPGFYGERLFEQSANQIGGVIDILRTDPTSRRAFTNIWRYSDLGRQSADLPCNVGVHWQCTWEGTLTATVYNRSNDLVWGGVSGANPVHFSFFQEYIALALGYAIGPLTFVSSNAHVYTNDQWRKIIRNELSRDKLKPSHVFMYPLNSNHVPLFEDGCARNFNNRLYQFFLDTAIHDGPLVPNFDHRFVDGVLVPMYNAYWYYKEARDEQGRFGEEAYLPLEACVAEDWRRAGVAWLARRGNQRTEGMSCEDV